eukprot:scaffold28955_cov65-Cyclotella_meneghiniana.AAC.4
MERRYYNLCQGEVELFAAMSSLRRQKTTIFGSAGFGSGFYGALLLLLLSFLSTFVTDIAKGSRV